MKFTSYPQLINLFEEIFVFETYYFASSVAEPFIIDCGSHLGVSILYFKKLYPFGTVLGFEPHANTFSLLQSNINNNQLRDVSIYNVALAGHEGKSAFYIHPSDNTLTPGLHHGDAKSEAGEVETRKLSGFINRQVDLLKIDVEGSETEILRDLLSSGKIGFIREIILEYHPEFAKTTLDQLLQDLKVAGFSCVYERDQLHPGATEWMIRCRAGY